MATPINQRVAARLLDVHRRGGYSFRLLLRWNAKRHIIALIYLVASVAFFAYVKFPGACFLMIGLFSGMWLRDFGYMRSAIKAWPFFNTVTNWEKVQQIADGELIA